MKIKEFLKKYLIGFILGVLSAAVVVVYAAVGCENVLYRCSCSRELYTSNEVEVFEAVAIEIATLHYKVHEECPLT